MRYSWLVVCVLAAGCIPQLDDPVDARHCVVERIDLDTERASDRWEFVGGRLAAQRVVRGPGTASEVKYERDGAGRMSRATGQTTQLAGTIPEWFRWNPVYVRYDTPIVRDEVTTYDYDERGNPVRVTRSTRLTTPERVYRSRMIHTYAYDRLGRKIAKKSTHFGEHGRGSHTRRYTYRHGRLHMLESELSADLTTSTVFSYDEAGRPTGNTHRAPRYTSSTKLEYDEDGNLVAPSAYSTFAYDDAGRLISEPIHGARFDYDAAGRLTTARYPDGAGYRMTYSAGCAAGFSHPAFTPHVDYHIHYEGPYEYRLTLPPEERDAFLLH